MVRLLHLVAAVILACVGVHAQGQPKAQPSGAPPPAAAKPAPSPTPTPTPTPAPALPPGVTISDPAWPMPPDLRGKMRDIQFQNDQYEIQNQKLQVQIEQNKAKQRDLIDQFKSMAFDFAQAQKIDLTVNELDYGELKFVKKKAQQLSLGK